LLDAIRRHLADGYKRLKIKIQRGWDVEPLSAIREEFGDIPLMVDANCAYTRGDIDHLRALDDFDLMMVEQPLPKEDLEGHAGLQSTLRTPVCLDESAVDAETVERAIRLGSCRIVNIKIQRAGGLEESVRIHDVCADHGIPVWAGTMPELGVGSVQTLHLATLPNFLYPTDVQASLRWFVDDCVDPLIEADGGIIRIAPGPGNGYRIDEGKVKKFLLRREVISMTGGVH
jgi:O-succinylbenzoate synthase